ncbi:putative actin-related protein [Rosellinia necatrix]|uniref:Putative actin-related protein n=1 Tax=Rosellinia necatrix TaxID=77044 RepID=A0A1W2TNZ8_ROSNE|nr:putative actin-related protein [Rosellinia necatrix]
MSSTAAPTSLPHRTVSSIRAGAHSTAAPGPPQTPARTISTTFGSPSSSSRADDDPLVIEIGSRKLRLGFAGDAAPKKIIAFSPEQQRRTGDFRAWELGYSDQWRSRATGKSWGADHELWQLDLRGQDLGLVEDKLERELRDALFKNLLADSRPRKFTLVLPPTLPVPLLSATLDTIFHRFQAPTVSLLSAPLMSAFAAGTRSALVIDLGWRETTVTAVYEYREVRSWRTVRAGKLLVEETYELLLQAVRGYPTTARADRTEDRLLGESLSFEECEEVATRMVWCKGAAGRSDREEGLATVHEHEEEAEEVPPTEDHSPMTIRLNSCKPPKTVEIPFSQLAEPCEATFFGTRLSPSCFDDHELPVHLLVYRALLQLPLDVRAICMSRIIFTGGCSQIFGLKSRIFEEVSIQAEEQGWDPVRGKGVEQFKTNPKLNRDSSRPSNSGTIPIVIQPDTMGGNGEATEPPAKAADIPQEVDHVEDLIRKERNYKPPVQGHLRAIDSLGPWCGGSLATQVKIPALATIDRDMWLQHGVNGASRPSEVDIKTGQRQSMGPSGMMRGQAVQSNNWTLGIWGALF